MSRFLVWVAMEAEARTWMEPSRERVRRFELVAAIRDGRLRLGWPQ